MNKNQDRPTIIEMGGCRCTYKTCKSATKNSENQHFFHFPVKHRERCIVWIQNAKRLEFMNLPNEQLRNKVVCANHFEDKYFTNTQRKRLVHDAIPTLDTGCEEDSSDVKDVQIYPTSVDGSTYTLQSDILPGSSRNDQLKGSNVSYKIETDIPTEVYTIDPKYIQQPFYSYSENFNSNNDDDLIIYKAKDDNFITYDNKQAMVEDEEEAMDDPPLKETEITEIYVLEEPPEEIPASKKMSDLTEPTTNNPKKQKLAMRRITKFKKNILLQLKGKVPETLLGALSLQFFKNRKKLSSEEKAFLRTLNYISPSAYKTLRDYGWHIPNHRLIDGCLVVDE